MIPSSSSSFNSASRSLRERTGAGPAAIAADDGRRQRDRLQ